VWPSWALQVDIGFGDVITPAPMESAYPVLLAEMAVLAECWCRVVGESRRRRRRRCGAGSPSRPAEAAASYCAQTKFTVSERQLPTFCWVIVPARRAATGNGWVISQISCP
jgi:hypothetical protein